MPTAVRVFQRDLKLLKVETFVAVPRVGELIALQDNNNTLYRVAEVIHGRHAYNSIELIVDPAIELKQPIYNDSNELADKLNPLPELEPGL